MPESLAEGRARWGRDHGIPWSQSPAGQAAASSTTTSAPPERGSQASAPGGSSLPQQIHAGLKGGGGGTVAGAMLGLFGFLILRSYLTGGTKGVTSFLAAKFANRTSGAGNPNPGGPTPAGPPKVFVYPFGWTDQPASPTGPGPSSTPPPQPVAA